MQSDSLFINQALSLAKKARGVTSPNPLVAAILVKNGKVIATGYHKRAGGLHAEAEALQKAGGVARGATLYVTLEPCCHYGRTPPCVDAVIKAGVRRVVVATLDPNPVVNGKSIRKLRREGVAVTVGVNQERARIVNEVFFKNMKTKFPFVVAKVAQSLDGKIATRSGASQWITSASARTYSRQLRDRYDSVLVGVNTVIADNPQLNGARRSPFKVVLDPHLRTPLSAAFIRKTPKKVVIVTDSKNKGKVKKFPSHTKIVFLKSNGTRGFALPEVLKALYALGIMSVFVEGGARTVGRFFDARLPDKCFFFIAPKIIGGEGALSCVGGMGVSALSRATKMKKVQIERIGSDILITGYPSYTKEKG